MSDRTDTRILRRHARLALGVSARALCWGTLTLAGAGAAGAQQTPPVVEDAPNTDASVAPDAAAAPGTAGEADEEAIVVTGFRASLESAIVAKRDRDIVVESISAEDIGKLPDASIAESIARLPGLTSQRVSGRSNSISIRGFSPDFSTTLLNGREQTSTGDNRAVEYDQYPSEVVSQVLVYKTPMASLVGQGLSGTVDIRTVRPLAYGKQTIAVGGRGTYVDIGALNSGSRDTGYRVNATYIDQFKDDTIGIALSASYLDEPYQIQEFNAWGYAGFNGNALIGGEKSFVTSTDLKRLGLQGTVELAITPTFTTSFDAFYSDFEDDQIKRGIELPLGFGAFGTVFAPASAVVEDGIVVSGRFNNVQGVVNNHVFQRKAKLYSFGWNGKYEGDDGWNVMGDIGYSATDRNELVLESNAGTGRGESLGATDSIGFESGPKGTTFTPTLNYGDYNLIQLTSPLGWGGNQTAVNGDRIIGGQDGYYNDRIIEDELTQYRLEIEKEIESNFVRSIQIGANYTDRSKSLTPDEAFLGLVANTNGLISQVVPEEFRKGTTDLDFLGLGPVISYDPLELLNAGIYQLVPNPYGDVVVKAYDVQEQLLTAYAQINLRSEFGDSVLTGNVGVQAIWTDQSSQGATAAFFGNLPNGAPDIRGIPIEDGASYVDVLPSINLSLRLASDFVIRVAAAREIIRPRMDDMRATFSYGINNLSGVVSGSSGNPRLRPWRANAYDLTFEKYFGNAGYLAAQFFYKDLKSYIYNADFPYDFTGFVVPPTSVPRIDQGFVNAPINGEGGSLYGVEVAGTIPFGQFADFLDGFGVTGGGSYTKTELEPFPGGDPTDIPGYSEWVVNGTGFFEKWGFSARGSVRYRSSFQGELSGFGATRTRRRALGETIIDGQIGYEFQEGGALEGLAIYLQGQNLTDERFATVDPAGGNRIIDYQTYGRRFLLGANFRF